MLITRSVHFGATTTHKVILEGKVSAPHGNYGVGERVFKMFIYNDGTADITVTLDGAEADAGYGLDYTTRGSVTVKAKSNAPLSAAIRGQEEHYRIGVVAASGEGDGRIEIYDQSNQFVR